MLAIAAGAAIAAGTYLTLVQRSHIADILWLLSTCLAFAVSYLHTRRLRIAVLVVLPVLGGVAMASAILTYAGVPSGAPVPAFAFGIALSTYLADGFIAGILADLSPADAAWETRRQFQLPAHAAMLAAVVLPLALLFDKGNLARMTALSVAMVTLVTFLAAMYAVPALLSLIAFDEANIAELNRVREKRTARAYWVSMVAVPRWGTSVSGIGLVFAVLAYFSSEAEFIGGLSQFLVPTVAAGVVFLGAGFASSGSWREAAAVFLAGCWILLFQFAFSVRIPGAGVFLPFGSLTVIAISLLATLSLSTRARQLRGAGDDPAVARLKSVEEGAIAITFATLGALAALVLWPRMDIGALFLLVVGALAAMVLTPALATALEMALPRRRSVEELYTRR